MTTAHGAPWQARSGMPARNVAAALAAVVLGLLQACSVATPWDGQPLWWLQILSLVGLVALLDATQSVKCAAWLGWLFATAWLTGSVWWLYISMHTYGGLAAPLAVLAVLGLCGFLALYYAAACAFYKYFRPLVLTHIALAAIIFAASWMFAELARDTWFTGFPWAAGGYAHVDGPMAASASLWGVYGLGFVASVLAVCLAQARHLKSWKTAVAMGLFLGSVAFVTLISVADARSTWGIFTRTHLVTMPHNVKVPGSQDIQRTTVALLQGNIPQGEKFDNSKGIPFALQWYAEQLMASTATLVVTPETAIALLPQQLPDAYWQRIKDRFEKPSGILSNPSSLQAALIGIPLGSYQDGYTNSVLGLQPTQLRGAQNVMQPQPYRYDKHHLVPFGEFIPPLFKWFTQMMQIPLGDFARGAVGQDSFEFADQRWAPNICYEDLFGDELAARFKDPAVAPTVLVNVSNIGWFGNSVAIDQHLHISRMRSIELGRPTLRATNTGPTVIINHRGQVTHSLPRHTLGVLMGSVEGRSGATPYAWWASRFGQWPLWIFCIAVLLMAFRTHSGALKS